MTDCDRCGRGEDATLTESLDGRVLCVVCLDWIEEQPTGARHVDQADLDRWET